MQGIVELSADPNKVLIIDNYDSFVYNLADYAQQLNQAVQVVRNDAMTIDELAYLNPSHLIISPGPCTPNEAGISLQAIKFFANKIPILGVCLGHQAIGQVFGGKVVRANKPWHGKADFIFHHEQQLFLNLTNPLQVGRYHSLIVAEENFPAVLEITARSSQGEIMALRHRELPIYGVQFHPESILTQQGHQLLANFFDRVKPRMALSLCPITSTNGIILP